VTRKTSKRIAGIDCFFVFISILGLI